VWASEGAGECDPLHASQDASLTRYVWPPRSSDATVRPISTAATVSKRCLPTEVPISPEVCPEVIRVFECTGGYDFAGVLQFVSENFSQMEHIPEDARVVCGSGVDRGAQPLPAASLRHERHRAAGTVAWLSSHIDVDNDVRSSEILHELPKCLRPLHADLEQQTRH
jgi:hypothetical protein